MVPQLPLLLVTETPPYSPNGFGVTLSCMFKETPHKVIYTDSNFKKFGESQGYTLAQVPFHRGRKLIVPFFLGKIPEWRGFFSYVWLTKHLKEKFSCVYAFIYSTDCMKYANWIAEKKKIPLCIHLADHSESFEKAESTQILLRASKLICITNEMKFKYEKMLGRSDIHVLHNGAEEKCYKIASPRPAAFSNKNPFILCFIGGLFSHLHGDCIEDIFLAIAQIRKKRPWIEFHLYGQRQPNHFLESSVKSSGCKHHGIVMPLEKKFEIMENAHCFILPSSFNAENHQHYRYSFPTKLPELIASGRPILSYGPKETATNKILEENNIGIRIYDRSITKVVKALEDLEGQYSTQTKKFATVKEMDLEKFSAQGVRKKLSKILKSH